ncbi:DUF2917 domain-containing protein [Undibacterium griseum]|uniref:DUF2917 domain-containing protein n=1 Tax=Undibacterium griseum TaxID=2762295 RepID=A0ABR6YRK4_9BURK|nr:DUF2917 domain-containing protein [Undibacterium griseum]MBC3886545.1 DUF2917 domain-containing protein [Undibacterium griseum]
MRIIDTSTALDLQGREVLSITAAQPVLLQLQSGLVWITVTDDENDYWLAGGERMHLPARRHVVIETDAAASRLLLTVLPQPEGGVLPGAAVPAALEDLA